MSVVSLARITGLTPVPAKTVRLTRLSRLETEVSMMSTTSCLTIASIESRNWARVLKRPSPGPGPTACRPGPISGSLASAMMKSERRWAPLRMRASLSSSLNMNTSPVSRPVYRALLTDGNWLERGRWRSSPVAASLPPTAEPACGGGVSMAKRLGARRNTRTVRGWLIAAAGLASALASVAGPAGAAKDDPYARPESWLCRPGGSDLCAAPVVATVVRRDGSRATRVFKPNTAAPIDCFYVYPTVSEDPAGNSGMTSGPGEKRAVAQQFAAFASVCRPFAPIYRQVTIAGLEAVLRHEPLPV